MKVRIIDMLDIKCTKIKNDNKIFINLDIENGKYSKALELKKSEVTLLDMIGIENVSAELTEKTSQKTGELYTCIMVSIGDKYETPVFLDSAEKIIIDFLADK